MTRIRGRKLQSIRKRILAKEPLCRECSKQGYVTIATEIDHIISLHAGGKDEAENRQPLCTQCHEAKTKRDMGYKQKVAVGLDGWPVG